MHGSPDILIYTDGLVCPPEQATREESYKQGDSINKLKFRPRHIQFIEEPVEIEEGRGELIENKCTPIKVEKGSL